MAIFDDVKEFVKNNRELSKKSNEEQFNTFYRFYYPNTNVNFLSDSTLKTDFIKDYKAHYDHVFRMNSILDNINDIDPYFTKITNFRYKKTYLTCKNNVRDIFNLTTIFNNIELSLKIPCMRIKDVLNDSNVYKLHKPAFNSFGGQIKPIVTENYFKKWTKSEIKKGLSIYVYIGKAKINNNVRKAKIINETDGTYKISYVDDTLQERFINKNIISGDINGPLIDVYTNDDIFLLVNIGTTWNY